MDEPRVVEPQEHAAVFAEPLGRILGRYGCVLAVDDESRCVAKGTFVLVEVDGEMLLVTAQHVAVAEVMQSHRTFLMLPRRDAAGKTLTGISVPKLIPFDLGTPLWSSPELDVAFFTLTPEVAFAAEAAFFGGQVSAEATATIRKRWRWYVSEKSSGAYFVTGFPSFGHLADEKDQVELLSALPLPSYITQLDEHPWDQSGPRAPQLILEADAHKPAEPPKGLEEHHRAMSENLFHPPEGVEPFGGYSGGPVIAVGTDGEYLIGIIHDGGLMYGQYRVFASAWDDCLAGLLGSREWRLRIARQGKFS